MGAPSRYASFDIRALAVERSRDAFPGSRYPFLYSRTSRFTLSLCMALSKRARKARSLNTPRER